MLKYQDIHRETTSPDTPKQNGDSKCQIWSIFDCVCTLLIDIDAGLPLFLFAEAVNYTVYTKKLQLHEHTHQHHTIQSTVQQET